uniref:Phytocyanin domain-containing protein n=1 Tax=Picea sitchensis TaxID=3332 RepID=A9NWZ4_PICSI|nr:unknown [Picea sitchensis]
MGRCFPFAFAVTACIVLNFWSWQTADAKTVIVGGSVGWTNFDDSLLAAPDYASWSSAQKIQTGDSLVFKYQPMFHDVYMLPTKKAFDYCNFTDSIVLDEGKSGSFTWIPSKQGVYYFSCNRSIEGAITHCEAGQKVTIRVSAKSGMQSPSVSPTLAPLVPSPSVTPSSRLTPLPIFPPSSTPSSPVSLPIFSPSIPSSPMSLPSFSPSSTPRSPMFPPSPEQSPTIPHVPSLSPSLSPTSDFTPAASPSSAPSSKALSPNGVLVPTAAPTPISGSPSPSLSVRSPFSSPTNSPLISSTPEPLSQVGADASSTFPPFSPSKEMSGAGTSVDLKAWRFGLFLSAMTSSASLMLMV